MFNRKRDMRERDMRTCTVNVYMGYVNAMFRRLTCMEIRRQPMECQEQLEWVGFLYSTRHGDL